MHPVRKANEIVKSVEGVVNIEKLSLLIKQANTMSGDAIPLEQLKGDIARAGHPIKQALALDPDGRRIFFTDVKGEHLYAEFASSAEGHRITHIGHQASIMKEYDVRDLETSGVSTVRTTHEEEEPEDDPRKIAGIYPGESYGVKPEEDDRGFGADDQEEATLRKTLLHELHN